jgi:hypothetical protein
MSINKRYRWVLLLDLRYLRFRLLLQSFDKRVVQTSLLSNIAIRRVFIELSVVVNFHLQSLYYFGIKVVPSMVTNHICTTGFP